MRKLYAWLFGLIALVAFSAFALAAPADGGHALVNLSSPSHAPPMAVVPQSTVHGGLKALSVTNLNPVKSDMIGAAMIGGGMVPRPPAYHLNL